MFKKKSQWLDGRFAQFAAFRMGMHFSELQYKHGDATYQNNQENNDIVQSFEEFLFLYFSFLFLPSLLFIDAYFLLNKKAAVFVML